MTEKYVILIVFVLLVSACTTKTIEVQNEKKGHLKSSIKLVLMKSKDFSLDEETAPKHEYSQIFIDTDKRRYLTFLNTYSGSIYFYDYNNMDLVKKISFKKDGPDALIEPLAYHIKSMDSIYVFENRSLSIVLVNDKSEILNKTSLLEGLKIKDATWTLKIPQFSPQSITPFIEIDNELLLMGQYMFSIPESIIPNFRFACHYKIDSGQLSLTHTYPDSLYGNNYNWHNDIITKVYYDYNEHLNQIILSFPVSHDLYISDWNGVEKYKKVYGGSNLAGTISSINKTPKRTSREELKVHYLKNDLYAGIKYDKYRKVYYRCLLRGMPNSNVQNQISEKPVVVVVMDEKFNYLGESEIGTSANYNWSNVFVTEEGLNIEYIEDNDLEEAFLKLHIFTIEKI